jgi:DNA-binding SARP family transcriptional activator
VAPFHRKARAEGVELTVAVEFQLLGDLEMRVDGRTVDLGHARQRCVLAVLLLEANRAVPADQLFERVWAGQVPQRARNTLAGYVSRLRQVLTPAGGATITSASGYLLTVDPAAVDLVRFRRTIAEARAAGPESDALALFDEALGLWRGTAFAGLDTPWLNAMRETVDAERLAAELERNDLALEAGRHAALLGELPVRSAAYPFDERLAGQLMLALYRGGRQADALRRYQQLRTCLADELGADPSPPLQQLHRRILTNDPDLAPVAAPAHRPVRPANRPPVPRQLPPPPRSFTGRIRELAVLDALADEAADQPTAVQVAAVCGTAGVGKTALALRWANRAAGRFGDGQLYVNLHGYDPSSAMTPPAAAMRSLLDTLGVPPSCIPADADAQSGLYRSLLADRQMLLVFDNARDADQVVPLLPGAGRCLVVVTSRRRLTGLVTNYGAHPIELDLLTPTEAYDMLADRLGRQRMAADPEAVQAIIDRCARLPLALAIVEARTTTRMDFPLGHIAADLAHAPDSLTTFDGGDAMSDVRSVFSWSYRTLTGRGARLFRLLGLHPGPDISTAAAASLAGSSTADARAALAELVNACLVTEPVAGRHGLHDLLRAYARQLTDCIDDDQQRHAAVHRMLDHYLHTANAAALVQQPHRRRLDLPTPLPGVLPEDLVDYDESIAWFAREHPILLGAIHLGVTAGFNDHVGKLAWTMWTFLDREGRLHDLDAVGQSALVAACRLDDPAAQATAHRMLGVACHARNHHRDAYSHLEQAANLYRRANDQIGVGDAYYNLVAVSEAQGHHPKALDHAKQALAQYQVAGDKRGQAQALNSIGWCHTNLGDHALAIDLCQQALDLQQALDDRVSQAATLQSLGFAHCKLGQHRQALVRYGQALDIFRKLDYRLYLADTLIRAGDTHDAAGDTDAAVAAWREGLAILEDLDHPGAKQLRAKVGGQP